MVNRFHRIAAVAMLSALAPVLAAGCPDYRAYGSCDDAAAATCDDGDPCTTDRCGENKQCVHEPAGDSDIATQTKGDCKKTSCRGGVRVDTADPTDAPDDSESCTADACVDGKPTSTPVTSGTACKTGDASGGCVRGKCVTSCKDSPDACDDGEPCTVDRCDTDQDRCVFDPLDGIEPEGVTQTAGDCRKHLCVAGKDINTADDTDLPKPDSTCVKAACVEGIPSPTQLAMGTACDESGGHVCDGIGHCIGCFDASDCTDLPADGPCQTRSCKAGKCSMEFVRAQTSVVGAQAPGDCQKVVCDGRGGQQTLADPSDAPDDYNDCTTDSCNGTEAVHTAKASGSFCGFALACNDAGKCAGCRQSSDCSIFDDECHTSRCSDGVCSVTFAAEGTARANQQPGDCLTDVCDGAGHSKSILDETDVPDDNHECTKDTCTKAGKAANPPDKFDAPCSTGHCDGVNECKACIVPGDCPSPGPCVVPTCTKDGCGTANLRDGVMAPASMQTAKDCVTVVCNGKGATHAVPTDDIPDDGKECTVDTCEGAVPRFTALAAGTPCPRTDGKVCDGNGSCGP
jgi:hypothetical protein